MHTMTSFCETFPALLSLCDPNKGPVMWSFDDFFAVVVVEITVKLPVIWDALTPILHHFNKSVLCMHNIGNFHQLYEAQ